MSVISFEHFALAMLFVKEPGTGQSHWLGLDYEPNILSRSEEDFIKIVGLRR